MAQVKRQPLILVDDREKDPWPLAGRRWRRARLAFGDYAVKGLESFAVERKSAADFVASISDGRLAAQCSKAHVSAAYLLVVVEASYADCAQLARLHALDLANVVAGFILEADVIPIFASSRGKAESIAVSILEKWSQRMVEVRRAL